MKRILISMNRNKGNVRDELRRAVFSGKEFENALEFHDSINLEDLKELSQKLKKEVCVEIPQKIKNCKTELKKLEDSENSTDEEIKGKIENCKKEIQKLKDSMNIRIGIDDCQGFKILKTLLFSYIYFILEDITSENFKEVVKILREGSKRNY